MKVLIVEDDSAFFKMVQLRLRSWREDVDITWAKSLNEARRILRTNSPPFQLIILDQHLPDGDSSQLSNHPSFQEAAVLAMSNDPSPSLPGQAVRAGAQHFLGKLQIKEPLFIPLLEALLERKHIERDLLTAMLKASRIEAIKRLLSTLRHEINNPLGAVIGGIYLIRLKGDLTPEQEEALKLVEASGNRINHVLKELCDTAELEEVTKGNEAVFQVPGDKKW